MFRAVDSFVVDLKKSANGLIGRVDLENPKSILEPEFLHDLSKLPKGVQKNYVLGHIKSAIQSATPTNGVEWSQTLWKLQLWIKTGIHPSGFNHVSPNIREETFQTTHRREEQLP